MNKLFFAVALIGTLTSCVSMRQARQIMPEEREAFNIIDTVSAEWTSIQILHITPSKSSLEEKALQELRAAAKEQGHSSRIDIRNIDAHGSFGVASIITYIPCFFLACNVQKITAWGEVVEYRKPTTPPPPPAKKKAEKVVVAENIVVTKRIAIINTVDDEEPNLKISDLNYLTDRLREIAAKTLPQASYAVMTQQSILAFLGSQEEMVKECKESEGCLAKLGRKVNADYVGQGRIGRFSGSLTIKFELYDSKSGNLVSSFTGISKDVFGLLSVLDKEAADAFNRISGSAQ